MENNSPSLVPVPKVLIPFVVLCIGIAVNWIATGDFSRVEIGAALSTGLYALIGYTVPPQGFGN